MQPRARPRASTTSRKTLLCPFNHSRTSQTIYPLNLGQHADEARALIEISKWGGLTSGLELVLIQCTLREPN